MRWVRGGHGVALWKKQNVMHHQLDTNGFVSSYISLENRLIYLKNVIYHLDLEWVTLEILDPILHTM